jgi:hypothetical protein
MLITGQRLVICAGRRYNRDRLHGTAPVQELPLAQAGASEELHRQSDEWVGVGAVSSAIAVA